MSIATPVSNIPAESGSSPEVYDKNNIAKKDFSESNVCDAIATEKSVTGKRGRQPAAAKKQTRKQASESANVTTEDSNPVPEDESEKELEPSKEVIDALTEPIVSEPVTPGTSESIEGKTLEGLTILSDSNPNEKTVAMEVPQNVDIDDRVAEPTISEPMTPEVYQNVNTRADAQESVDTSVEQMVDQVQPAPAPAPESEDFQAKESSNSPMECDDNNDNKDDVEDADVDFPMTQIPLVNNNSKERRHDVTPASSQEQDHNNV